MGVLAVIRNDVVENLIVAEGAITLPGATLVDVTGASPRPARGWTYADSIFAPPVPDLEAVRRDTLRAIDSRAGEVRSLFITEVPGQQGTYLLKAADAHAYIDAGYPPDASPYVWVEAEAAARGVTATEVADLIVAEEAQWIQLGVAIEQARMGGKTAVRAAGDVATIETTLADTLAALDAIAEQAE